MDWRLAGPPPRSPPLGVIAILRDSHMLERGTYSRRRCVVRFPYVDIDLEGRYPVVVDAMNRCSRPAY